MSTICNRKEESVEIVPPHLTTEIEDSIQTKFSKDKMEHFRLQMGLKGGKMLRSSTVCYLPDDCIYHQGI